MLAALCKFYLTYLGKMLLLRRQSIRGNIMGKGNKPKTVLFTFLRGKIHQRSQITGWGLDGWLLRLPVS